MSSLDISELFLQIATRNGGKLFGLAADSINQVSAIVSANFSAYFEEAARSCVEVHTIYDRNRPIDLRKMYTPVHLEYAGAKVSDTKFRSTVVDLPDNDTIRTFLVIGSAGTGKTMLLRYMFITMIENMCGKIPFYIPLRRYNSFSCSEGAVRFFHSVISNFRAQIDFRVFENEIMNGGFIFLLDGLDEVYPDKRNNIMEQIRVMQRTYSKTVFLISSRPDEGLVSWDRSRPYHILPMQKKDVISLIKKIPYRKDFKMRFLHDVDAGLYEQHTSFLSNPLLASIMLLTYSDMGRIPERMHLFYEQAFETLFYRHDTSKEAGFYRRHYCDLPINRFRDCLSSFCIATYTKMLQEFTMSMVLEYIKRAVDFEKLDVKEDLFLRDLLETVCILQVDGLYIRFTHRSFQEYFAAVFIARNIIDLPFAVRDLLDAFCERQGDYVIYMGMDMNRSFIEREWIMVRLKSLTHRLTGYGTDIIGLSKCLFEELRFVGSSSMAKDPGRKLPARRSNLDGADDAHKGGFLLQKPTSDGHFIYSLRKFYPGAIAELDTTLTNADFAIWQEWWIKEWWIKEWWITKKAGDQVDRMEAERTFQDWWKNDTDQVDESELERRFKDWWKDHEDWWKNQQHARNRQPADKPDRLQEERQCTSSPGPYPGRSEMISSSGITTEFKDWWMKKKASDQADRIEAEHRFMDWCNNARIGDQAARVEAERKFGEWWIREYVVKADRMDLRPSDNEWLKQSRYGLSLMKIVSNMLALRTQIESEMEIHKESKANLFR